MFRLGEYGYHELLAELLPVQWVCCMNMLLLAYHALIWCMLQHAQLRLKRLKESMALLEVDFTEFKELTQGQAV